LYEFIQNDLCKIILIIKNKDEGPHLNPTVGHKPFVNLKCVK